MSYHRHPQKQQTDSKACVCLRPHKLLLFPVWNSRAYTHTFSIPLSSFPSPLLPITSPLFPLFITRNLSVSLSSPGTFSVRMTWESPRVCFHYRSGNTLNQMYNALFSDHLQYLTMVVTVVHWSFETGSPTGSPMQLYPMYMCSQSLLPYTFHYIVWPTLYSFPESPRNLCL